MKSSTRLLPRLDQLYTQKKSYEIHRQKILSINRSSSFSKRSISQSRLPENQQENKSQRSLILQDLKSRQPSVCQTSKDAIPQTHMQTIEETKPGISYWLKKMNPHQKRIRQQQIKQNKRMHQKIKNTMSFITKGNQLNDHQQHYSGMKRMLSKFSVDENSQKTRLKCDIVLTKINELEKSKLKLQESRLMKFDKRDRSTASLSKVVTPKTIEKSHQSFLTKRSKILSQKISSISKQNTTSMKDHLLKRPNQNLFTRQTNPNSLTRQKTHLLSRTNELKTSISAVKQIPSINQSSHRYNRVKTELIQRASQHRLFNNSKLSNLSVQSSKPKISFSDYKIVKVNYTQQRPNSLRRMPNIQSTSFDKAKPNNMTVNNQVELKRFVVGRIKTEGSDMHKSSKVDKGKDLNKFDFQKKRIERFLKSKSSLSNKEVKVSLPMRNQPHSSQNVTKIHTKKQIQTDKVIPTIEQKSQSKMVTIQQPLQKTVSQQISNTIKKQPEENSSTCFATQIQ